MMQASRASLPPVAGGRVSLGSADHSELKRFFLWQCSSWMRLLVLKSSLTRSASHAVTSGSSRGRSITQASDSACCEISTSTRWGVAHGSLATASRHRIGGGGGRGRCRVAGARGALRLLPRLLLRKTQRLELWWLSLWLRLRPRLRLWRRPWLWPWLLRLRLLLRLLPRERLRKSQWLQLRLRLLLRLLPRERLRLQLRLRPKSLIGWWLWPAAGAGWVATGWVVAGGAWLGTGGLRSGGLRSGGMAFTLTG